MDGWWICTSHPLLKIKEGLVFFSLKNSLQGTNRLTYALPFWHFFFELKIFGSIFPTSLFGGIFCYRFVSWEGNIHQGLRYNELSSAADGGSVAKELIFIGKRQNLPLTCVSCNQRSRYPKKGRDDSLYIHFS